jgi:hypothetical protein
MVSQKSSSSSSSSPVTESEAKERLPVQLAMIAKLENHAETRKHWDLALPGSELDEDDKCLRPYQSSHLIGHCLAVALDAMRSTRLIMQKDESFRSLRLPLIGVFPVLRAATEAGALAIWLLQPEDVPTRLLRSLQTRWDDIQHDDRAAIALLASDPDDTKTDLAAKNKARKQNTHHVRSLRAQLLEVSTRNNVPKEHLRRGLPGFGPLTEAAATSLNMRGSHTRGAWHMLSGLSHPSASRTALMSSMAIEGETGTSIRGFFTAKPSVVGLALDSAIQMYLGAQELVAEKGGDKSVRAFSAPDA